jgi:predicted nuclease of predicted toxin-antitoxin system
VISKDADFVNSFLLVRRPNKLLSVSTGNITNAELEALFVRYIDRIIAAFETNDYLELSHAGLVVHM